VPDVQRFAASTLGLPDAGLDEIVDVLTAGGCAGVELRAGEKQAVHTGLSQAERAAVKDRLAQARLHPLAVSSYVKICAPGDDQPIVDDLLAHIELAADLGADGVRIFPGGDRDASAGQENDERGRRRLGHAIDPAAKLGVRLLIETHDSHPRGQDVARLLSPLDDTATLGVIWDFVHPWRNGEDPRTTYDAIAPWLAYVQLKDAVPPMERPTPALIGAGEVPLDEIRGALDAEGYDGWWSLEWEKAWHPDIPALPEALDSARGWLTRR
jgi:sugar phosphate isomerase/epimerase